MESLCIRKELTTTGLVWNINIAAVHCFGTPVATAVKTRYTERKQQCSLKSPVVQFDTTLTLTRPQLSLSCLYSLIIY